MPWVPDYVTTGYTDIDGGEWNEGATFVLDCGEWDDPAYTPYYDCGDLGHHTLQMDTILVAVQKVNANVLGIYTDIYALQNGVLIHKDLDGGDVT